MTIQHMTSVAPPLTLAFGQSGIPMMTLNDREHWRTKARTTKLWRQWAFALAKRDVPIVAPRATFGPSIVTVELPVQDNRRRDPHNYIATVKPIIDGLVDAGLWPDDTPEWVSVAEPRLIVRRDHLVRILIDPRTPAPATKEKL